MSGSDEEPPPTGEPPPGEPVREPWVPPIDPVVPGPRALTVWKFPYPFGPEQAERILQDLQKQAVIQIYDAAVVSWPEGAKKPKARQLMGPTGAGALGGAFWGLLFGLIFFVPLLGMAIGAGMGALTGSLTDVGINDEFINRMRAEITPGTSALLVLSSGPVVDKVRDAFAGQPIELIQTNLSKEEADKLRSVFSDTS